MNEGNFFKRHKKFIIILVVAVLIAAAVLIYVKHGSSSETSTESSLNVQEIEKRTIVQSISGTGTVVSVDSEEVGEKDVSGQEILTIDVAEGDEVIAGATIATLDTSDLEEEKADLQEQIAELQQDKAERHTDYDESVADAETTKQENISETKASLDSAKSDLAQAEADLAQAQATYDEYIAAGGSASSAEASQMQSVIEQKKANVTTKQSRVDSLESQLKTYEETETSTQEQKDALSDFDSTTDDSISALQEQIDDINDRISKSVLTTSVPGTVTAINYDVGDTYNGGTLALIEGVDVLQVEAYVDEYDIADVEKGMEAVLKTDSTREEELPGTVTFVSPKASGSASADLSVLSSLSDTDMSSLTGGLSSSDSATYLVRISIDGLYDRLRLGMNARVSIIIDKAEDVWSVPYEAVLEREDGSYYIEVLTEEALAAREALEEGTASDDEELSDIDEVREIDVTVGIEGTYYTQITSDELTEGMYVVVPDSATEESVDDLLNMIGAGTGV